MSQVPIKGTFSAALRLLFREARFFVALGWGPVLVTSALLMGAYLAKAGTPAKVWTAIATIAQWLFTVRLAVCWHRVILLEERPRSPFFFWKWTLRDFRFALYWFAMGFFIGMLFFLIGLASNIIMGIFSAFIWLQLTTGIFIFLGGSLLYAYLLGRLSLILPVTAIDRQPDANWTEWAWNQSDGNEWSLAVLIGIIPMLVWILSTLATDSLIARAKDSSASVAAMLYGVTSVVTFAAILFGVTLLSLALKRLPAYQTDILPASTEPLGPPYPCPTD